ncbi:DUF1801 domain-containing protein [Demequina activiva]|uniref:YdhG-like domain-containing protein n=1 Tax=Demequina activiva TaxID=1582364 RepID=A0A919ULA4_9MICO|nr:DUF1801 domain-containing protein [Demequina activiva]GIG54523.1 hypothetical protein Dac01nite_12750 [Demequina activiva]
MAQNTTQPTDQPVEQFLSGVEPERRREEAWRLVALIEEVTGASPVMWGTSIVGFGHHHYRYASGREGDWMNVGFSPRKAQMSVYGIQDHPGAESLLARLGPHTTGAGCVYVKRLDAVDEGVLRELVELAFQRGDHDATA